MILRMISAVNLIPHINAVSVLMMSSSPKIFFYRLKSERAALLISIMMSTMRAMKDRFTVFLMRKERLI